MSYHNVYGFDTETDNDGKTAWIAQWALSNGEKEIHGTGLRDFVENCLKFLARKREKSYVYIWNLKYDLEFIKYGIWKFCEETGYECKVTMRKGNPISVNLVAPKQAKIQNRISFRDGAKKMQGTLREIAPLFGMEKLEGPAFVPGWSEKEDFTKAEAWDYVHMDARIVAVAMQYMHRNGFTKSTSSGDAWNTAKRMMATSKDGKQYQDLDYKWSRYFPILSYELDHDLRDGYFGGINISENIGVTEGPLEHVDMTSMYPTVLYWDPLPVGIPSFCRGVPADGYLWVGKLHIKLNLKPNRVAWFQFKNGIDCDMEGIEYGKPVVWTQHYHYLTLTNIDLVTLMEDYDVEEDPEEYGRYFYVFKQSEGLFRPYIDRFIKQKNESPKGSAERAQAKIMLNALYGRFALIPEGEETELVYSEEEQDLVWKSTPVITEDMDSYLPYAMFTTAYARARLLHLIRKVCEARQDGSADMIHSDTDSVIHRGERILDPELEYDNGLGTWATESNPIRIYEGGFKRYIEVLHEPVQHEKDLAVACAGVPQHKNHLGVPIGMWVELLDDPALICTEAVLGHDSYSIRSPWLRKRYKDNGMDPDHVNTNKLIPVKVPGGVILQERQHKLSDNLQMRLRR